MAFATLEDLTGQCDLIIFPNVFEKVGEVFQTPDPVVIEGIVEIQSDQAKVIVQNIHILKKYSQQKVRAVRIRIPIRDQGTDQLKRLKTVLLENRGSCPVRMSFIQKDGAEAEIQLPESFRLAPTPRLAEQVNQLVGEDVVEFLPTRFLKYSLCLILYLLKELLNLAFRYL